MARLTYGSVVAALAALVTGFFVRTSNLPLIVSIGFSALATLLILFGWGRRLRAETRAGEATPEVDFIDLEAEEAQESPVRARLAARREERARRAQRELPLDMTDEMPVVAAPKPKKSKPRPRPPKARTASYVDLDADLDELAELVAVPVKPKRSKQKPPAPKPKPGPKPKPAPKPRAPKHISEVVVVPGRGRYHRASCRFADRPEATTMSVVAARRRGYEACSVCNPDVE
jgi:hypothetical protein